MASQKLELIKKSYDEVNLLTKHEDAKAERALTAMAFLTIAASAVIAASVEGSTYLELSPILFKVGSAFFIAFIILVAAGTFILIWGIFPRFNIPPLWQGPPDPFLMVPKSLFFGILINNVPQAAWKEYWHQTSPADLEAKAFDHLVYETHLISEKIVLKVRWTSWGIRLYLASLIPFAIFIVLIALSAIY